MKLEGNTMQSNLKCAECGKTQTLTAKNIDEIIKLQDYFQWNETPEYCLCAVCDNEAYERTF